MEDPAAPCMYNVIMYSCLMYSTDVVVLWVRILYPVSTVVSFHRYTGASINFPSVRGTGCNSRGPAWICLKLCNSHKQHLKSLPFARKKLTRRSSHFFGGFGVKKHLEIHSVVFLLYLPFSPPRCSNGPHISPKCWNRRKIRPLVQLMETALWRYWSSR